MEVAMVESGLRLDLGDVTRSGAERRVWSGVERRQMVALRSSYAVSG